MLKIADLLFLQRILQFVILLISLQSLPQGLLQLPALLFLLLRLVGVLDDHWEQFIEVLAAGLIGLGGSCFDVKGRGVAV